MIKHSADGLVLVRPDRAKSQRHDPFASSTCDRPCWTFCIQKGQDTAFSEKLLGTIESRESGFFLRKNPLSRSGLGLHLFRKCYILMRLWNHSRFYCQRSMPLSAKSGDTRYLARDSYATESSAAASYLCSIAAASPVRRRGCRSRCR